MVQELLTLQDHPSSSPGFLICSRFSFLHSVFSLFHFFVHIIVQSGHDQSLIKLVTVNDSRGKDVVLVLANFLKTRWTLDISNKVNLKKIYLVHPFTTAENKNRSLLWSCYEIQD
jgi:hypothetical protein